MNSSMVAFNSIIGQCTTTMGVYEYFESNAVPIDASDLLRWQYVLAVSALDKYVHDVVLEGMLKEFVGKKTETAKYKTVRLTLASLTTLMSSQNPEMEFKKALQG